MENLELNEEQKLDQKKSNLIADLLATNTVLEEVWNYHPDNPNKKHIISEYKALLQIKKEIEDELKEIE